MSIIEAKATAICVILFVIMYFYYEIRLNKEIKSIRCGFYHPNSIRNILLSGCYRLKNDDERKIVIDYIDCFFDASKMRYEEVCRIDNYLKHLRQCGYK